MPLAAVGWAAVAEEEAVLAGAEGVDLLAEMASAVGEATVAEEAVLVAATAAAALDGASSRTSREEAMATVTVAAVCRKQLTLHQVLKVPPSASPCQKAALRTGSGPLALL